jgi:hypothetical protein
MFKFLLATWRYSQSKVPTSTLELDTMLSYYKSGKSTISISQHLASTCFQSRAGLYPNFYIDHEQCLIAERDSNTWMVDTVFGEKRTEMGRLMNIFRVIVGAGVKNTNIEIDVNSVRGNPFVRKLVEMRENNKFITNASQIIIVSIIIYRMQIYYKKLGKIQKK